MLSVCLVHNNSVPGQVCDEYHKVYPLMSAVLHIKNARIWTGDSKRPRAHSITIRDGRIESLDCQPGAHSFVPEQVVAIDAMGKTITPGLIDAHLHMLRGGKSLSELNLASIHSRKDFEAAIARRHAQLPSGQWLIASGWSQENWPDHDLPDKSWLAAAGKRPVVCHRMDMHMALVNDAVLSMCDLSREPVGGAIARDARTGEPAGLMIEAAAWQLVNPLIPEPDLQMRRRHLMDAQRHLNSLGVTTIGTMEYANDVREVLAPMHDQLTVRCRITLMDREWPLDCTFARTFSNDDRLAIIGCKAFIDGTLGSRTARMLEDYSDEPGNRGMLVELAASGHLNDWVRLVAGMNLSPSMHAIGDEAVRLALDAIESIPRAQREKVRPRIEHAQQIAPQDIARFRGARIASMQPLHKADDCRYVQRRLGKDRMSGTFAFRSLHNAGAVLAFGSDWPVVSCDPMLGIRTAVTGVTLDGEVFGADQNLSVEEALRAYTTDAAFALGLDDAGVLGPGVVGDMVMFDCDPFESDWISNPPRIELTIVNGQVVYDGRRCSEPTLVAR